MPDPRVEEKFIARPPCSPPCPSACSQTGPNEEAPEEPSGDSSDSHPSLTVFVTENQDPSATQDPPEEQAAELRESSCAVATTTTPMEPTGVALASSQVSVVATAAANLPENASPPEALAMGQVVSYEDLPSSLDYKDQGRDPLSIIQHHQQQSQQSPPNNINNDNQSPSPTPAPPVAPVSPPLASAGNSVLAKARRQLANYLKQKSIDSDNVDEAMDPAAYDILAVAMQGFYTVSSPTMTYATTATTTTAPPKNVCIRAQLQTAIDGTQHFSAGEPLPMKRSTSFLKQVMPGGPRTKVSVLNSTTIQAALSLAQRPDYAALDDFRLGILNFAGALQPGGGFLWGAKSQEAALSTTTLLYPCLQSRVGRPNEYYALNAQATPGLYTDCAYVTPQVPIVRTDDASWLETPVLATVVSLPAPNRTTSSSVSAKELDVALEGRIQRALDLFAHADCTHLVLGSYGCGVFGNDPAVVARHMKRALLRRRGHFQHVVFSILARNPKEAQSLQVFEQVFKAGIL